MMTLQVVATGSTGNCYILWHEGRALVLDAGVKAKRIVQAVGYDPSLIDACLITHEHGDHSLAVADLDTIGIPCYGTTGTASVVPGLRCDGYAKGSIRQLGNLLVMDFPSQPPVPCPAPPELEQGLGASPLEVLQSKDYLALFSSPDEILELEPDMALLGQLGLRGVIATAPGAEVDFVSRAFFPKYGIDEDPVTGSAHCALAPFWSERLGRRKLHAFQLSARGGELFCEHRGERVTIAGRASLSRQGFIEA